MLSFFDNARHDMAYPVSDIVSIGAVETPPGGIGRYRKVKLRDGPTITTPAYELDRVFDPIDHRLPAEPGYAVYHPSMTAVGKITSFTVPIIAWGFERSGGVVPITLRGEYDNMSRPVPILAPTGEIYAAHDEGVYPDPAAFMADLASLPNAESDGLLWREPAPAIDDAIPIGTAALLAQFDAYDAASRRLRTSETSDADRDAWSVEGDALLKQVLALPNTPENLRIRARAVGSGVDNTSDLANLSLHELGTHAEGDAGEIGPAIAGSG